MQWAALLLALLALSWQNVVVRAHVHAGIANAAPRASGSVRAPDRAPADPAKNCPLCQDLASAGNYLLPGPIVVQAPEARLAWFTTPSALALVLRQHPRGWRSRAPPFPTQA